MQAETKRGAFKASELLTLSNIIGIKRSVSTKNPNAYPILLVHKAIVLLSSYMCL